MYCPNKFEVSFSGCMGKNQLVKIQSTNSVFFFQERITRGNYGDERFTYSIALVFSQCVGSNQPS